MIGKLIMFVTVLAAGFLVGSYIMGAPLLTFSSLQGHAENIWLFLQEYWTVLITGIGGAITGVGYLASKVIGKKNEEINSLNQTTNQQAEAIDYLEKQLKTDEGIVAFTEKYGKDAFEKVQNLSTDLQVTKTTLDEKLLEIKDWETKQEMWDSTRHRLEEDTRALNSKIKKLQYDLDVATGKIQLPIK